MLSPRTIKEYSEMVNRFPEWFCKMQLSDIAQIDISRLINEFSKDKSPKTVRNYHGFLTALFGAFRPGLKISTTPPQKVKSEPYPPSQEDVRKILEESKGASYEAAIYLACYGLRRSEICALKPEDIEGDVMHINKAFVQNEKNNRNTA